MSKRKVVKLNLEFVKKKIKEKCRSNVVFCELMGRSKQKTWVTGWGIEKNLPSPEEAARMCAILQVTPEEILTEPEDIELVRGLIDEQKEKPAPDNPGTDFNPTIQDWENALNKLTPKQKEAWDLLCKMDNDVLEKFINAAKAMLGI